MLRLSPALVLPSADVHAEEASPEAGLVVRVQRGDGAAFRALFDLHAPAVHRFLGDLFKDPGAADEATQETFVRAYQQLVRRASVGCGFRPWVLGIARNVFREQCRRSRRLAVPFQPRGEEEGEPTAEELELADRATPESLLLHREASARLEAALARLSPDRREVLLLRFDHVLSCAEVAQVLGWSVAKVKVEVHRARHDLRRLMEEKGRV